jgi:tRNA threonylcarbamoyladenosine biosynthesis protein TsaE
MEIHTHSENETEEWAESFGKSLLPGSVIALDGNLGAGKTVISRGICKALGYRGSISSPSYTLVHEYPNDPPLYHLDLYRLAPHADLQEIGLDHYLFNGGVTLIEWPERLEKNTAGITHRIHIQILPDDGRKITVEELPHS